VNQTMTSDSSAPTNINEQISEAASPVSPQTNESGNTATVTTENAATVTEPAAVSELSQEIESLKTQVEERNGQYARLAADFENYRKRMQKDKEDSEQQVKRVTIMELLPVVDNFERARSLLKPQNELETTMHKSYQSVYKQLVESLKRLGVSPMRPEGEEFDPNLHEAVMREPTDEHPEGTVLEELVRGYYLGDRVLRHAMVKVAAPGEGTSADSSPIASS
jgi:molecular chaperone GrpE